MSEEILKLKAEIYDTIVKIESLQKDIDKLMELKKSSIIKIEALATKPNIKGSTVVVNEIDDKTRMKQQRIMKKRLNITPNKPRNEVAEEDD